MSGLRRRFLKVLSLFIIFSMLSNYMFVCSEIADVVLATEFESRATSSVELNSNENNEVILENEENGDESERKVDESPQEPIESDELKGQEDIVEPDNEVLQENETEENIGSDGNEILEEELETVEEQGTLENEEDTDSSDIVMPETSLENYLVNLDFNVNRFMRFNNSFGKGIIVDGTLKIDVKSHKEHDVKVEFNMPQISEVSPIKYKIRKLDDNISLMHNPEENKMTLNISSANENTNEEVRIELLYDETAYDGNEIKIAGTITREDYIEEANLEEVTDNYEMIEKETPEEKTGLFKTRKTVNYGGLLSRRFNTSTIITREMEGEHKDRVEESIDETELVNDVSDETENNLNTMSGETPIVIENEEDDVILNDEQEQEEFIEEPENIVIDDNYKVDEFELNKKVENIDVSYGTYETNASLESRYKGLLYANLKVKEPKDINYITTDEIDVEDAGFIDYIEVDSKDRFITKENTEIPVENGILYKKVKIAEEEYNRVLGESGYIEIYDGQKNKIATIYRSSEKENGNYVYSFPSLISNITYKLIKPEHNGIIKIRCEKSISKNLELTKEQILNLEKIETENTNRSIKEFDKKEVAIQEIITKTEMRLEDTKTEISLSMDTDSLSTQMENEISFEINLKTNSEENEIFENPMIELVFPYAVEEVELGDINLLHRNGLSLSSWGVEKTGEGNQIIKIKLEGTQEEYNLGALLDGTSLKVDAKVKVNRLTTSEKAEIKLRYTNEAGTRVKYAKEGKDGESYEVKYVSDKELLTVTNVNNFNEALDVLSEINTTKLVGKADVGKGQKTSTVELNVINNLKEDIDNVTILGRLPAVGNVDSNGNTLDNTLDICLEKGVITSGLLNKIYYSEDINAEINSNTWKENIEDFSKVKCFKIEIDNKTMHQGENLDLSYNLVIPENLDYNETIHGTNIISYQVGNEIKTKDVVVGVETEEKEITIDEFENIKETEKLSIGTKVTQGAEEIAEGQNINERQILRYTTIVKNKTNEKINNIKFKGNAHNANMFYWKTYNIISSSTGAEITTGEWVEDKEGTHKYDELTIEELEPGENAIFEYQVLVNDLSFLQDFNNKKVYGQIEIEADGIAKQSIETQKNPIVDGELEINLSLAMQEDISNSVIETGDDYNLRIYVKNITNKVLKNVEVNLILPERIEYDDVTEIVNEYNMSSKETASGRIVTIVLDEMQANEEQELYIYNKIRDMEIKISAVYLTVKADAYVNGRRYIANEYTRTIMQGRTEYDIDFYGNKEDGSKLEDGEEVEYTFTAKNKGVLDDDPEFFYKVPNGLSLLSIDLYREDGSKENLYTKLETDEADEENKTNDTIEKSEEDLDEIELIDGKNYDEDDLNGNDQDTTTSSEEIEDTSDDNREMTQEELLNEFQTGYETAKQDENSPSDEENQEYTGEGYSKEGNYYARYITIKGGETVKIVVRAKVDISIAEAKQDKVVSTVNFRYDPIDKVITYYIDVPDEDFEEEVQEQEEEEPIEEIPENNEDVLTIDESTLLPNEESGNEYNDNNGESGENNYSESEQENIDNEIEENNYDELDITNNNLETDEINDDDYIYDETDQEYSQGEKQEDNQIEDEEKTGRKIITSSSQGNILQENTEKQTNIYSSSTIPSMLNTTQRSIDGGTIAPTEEENEGNYSISGTVWDDKNSDGQYDNSDSQMSNIKVELYKEDGNKAIKTVKTNDKGEYTFENLPNGKYVVLFEYDNEEYSITNYNSDNSNDETINVTSNKTIRGKKFGVSDTISIENKDVTGLNMGLKSNNIFDFGVKTYISKLKVKTSKGTDEYEYKEGDLAKIEIPSKNIDGAEVTATLIIKVENKGNLEGIVTSLKNETLGGWTFNEILNKEWTIGEDGNLYYKSLENDEIGPEENREIKLILTKTMDGNSTGVFTNKVEIKGTSNKLQLEDKKLENDLSEVEFIISIKTGIVTYIIIAMVLLLIFAIIIIIVNLKLLDKVNSRNKKRINIIMILVCILILLTVIVINEATAAVYSRTVGSGKNKYTAEAINRWATGGLALGTIDNLGHNSNYSRIANYMTNFYGVGTRAQLVGKNWDWYDGTDSTVRTMMCIHFKNQTSDFKPYDNKRFKLLASVDYGWNNGYTSEFNKGFGDSRKKSNTSKASNWRAQYMGYMGYALENHIWPWRSGNQAMYKSYKWALGYTVRHHSSADSFMDDLTGFSLQGTTTGDNFQNKSYLDDFKNKMINFNDTNADSFGLAGGYAVSKESIKVRDVNGNNQLSIVTIDGRKYVTGMAPKFACAGRNSLINNIARIQYSTNGGSSYTDYTGRIYFKKNGNLTSDTQDSDYRLNKTDQPFRNKKLYIPVSAFGASNMNSNFRIRVVDRFNTYESRFLFFYSSKSGAQNTSLLRGQKTRDNGSSYVWKFNYGVTINKEVDKIDNKTSEKTYAEKGCTVHYKITIAAQNKNGGATTAIEKISFKDTHTGLKFVSCSGSLTRSGDTFTYNGTINPGNKATVYIDYIITEDNAPQTNKAINNTVKITHVESGSGTNITSLLNTSNSILESTATVYMKMYKVGINKYVYKCDGTKTSGRDANKTALLYVDYQCPVVFAVKLSNAGSGRPYGNMKNFKITDTFNTSQMTFVGASINDSNYTLQQTGTAGKWAYSTNGGTISLSYNGEIAPGGSAVLYLKFTNISISKTSNIKVTNAVTVTNCEQHHGYLASTTDANRSKLVPYPALPISSSDCYYSKMYNIGITKTPTKYVEVGEKVDFKITITNIGSSNAYGNLKNIVIEDALSGNRRNDGRYFLTFEGFHTNPSAESFLKSGSSDGWSMVSTPTADASTKYKLKYTNSIAPGKSAVVYVRYTVSHGDKTNKTITNTATILETTTKDNKDIFAWLNGTLKANASVTIKKYTANVQKYIYSTWDGDGEHIQKNDKGELRDKDKTPEVTIEGGMSITYKIVITNTGTNSDKDGIIKQITLKDLYPGKVLKIVDPQNYGAGWSRKNNDPNTFIYSGSLGLNKSTTLTLKLKVVGVDATLEKDENGDFAIENKATLENQSVFNSKGVNINADPNKILNGNLTDSDKATLLISRLEISKYIIKLNNVSLASRAEMKNEEKRADPVEVEKNNIVTYRIEVKNVGRTLLKKVAFKDTLETGLEFDGDTVAEARKYANDQDTTGVDIKGDIQFTKESDLVRNIVYEKDFNGGEIITVDIKCKVVKTNLYLLNLKNELKITSVINRAPMEILNTDFLDIKRNDNLDFVRLKDLIISGTLWLDEDLDGIRDEEELPLKDIKVTLHDATNGKKATVRTNEDGEYKFSETNGVPAREGATDLDKKMVLKDNRVVKATNKDFTRSTGNYDITSVHINYYLEFEYDGGKYETTPVYANDDHIIKENNLYEKAYETDSNAKEYADMRKNFDEQLETIYYNEAMANDGRKKVLEYDKDGHVSSIIIDNDTAASMFAYSFMDPNKNGADGIQDGDLRYLWFKNGSNQYDGETEYLKYINVGLTERRFDLKIEQDVYSVKNTINGQEITYDFAQRGENDVYGGEYITGGEGKENYDEDMPYTLDIYKSDYYYNPSQYKYGEVQNYKQDTQLNTEVTFKVKITNEKVDDNKNVSAIIREVADYYSTNFMEISNEDKTIKMLDSNGYLVDKPIKRVEAWYKNESGTDDIPLDVSADKKYGEIKTFLPDEEYRTLYITGFDRNDNEIKLKEGEDFEFYIKFVVDLDEYERIKLGPANSIAEINAYSTYRENGDPAGYIDRDSNPGNIGEKAEREKKIARVDLYEDDTFRSGIDLRIDPDGKERELTGLVWDDSRTEELIETGEGTQYYGDGLYDSDSTKEAKGKKNRNVEGILDDKDENSDTPIEGIHVGMVEIIKIPDGAGGNRYYEERIRPYGEGAPESTTDENGEYTLRSFIPGKYETHFEYGYSGYDGFEGAEGTIGAYHVAGNDAAGKSMEVFNGHDYKSTKYNTALDNITNEDEILTKLTDSERLSDARDDEIDRLKVIEYSEKMNYRKSDLLQRTQAQNTMLNPATESILTIEDVREKAANTKMTARTKEFKIKPENVEENLSNPNQYTFNFGQYSTIVGTNGTPVTTSPDRYKLENIDFGVEYRPEVAVALKKYISRIKVKVSTGESLLDIKYSINYKDGDESKTIESTVIDKDNSIGVDNLQELRTVDRAKGFEYINIDTDLLQGATIEIYYLFTADNEGEIDRISPNLDDLAYMLDAKKVTALKGSTTAVNYNINQEDYTASGTARKQMISDFYNNDSREYRTKELTTYSAGSGYYGRYLGQMYYIGEKKDDVIAKVKVNKVLDYIDNDITFSGANNSGEDNLWTTTNTLKLVGEGFVKGPELLDARGIKYSINDNNTNDRDEKSNLAITVDDRLEKNGDEDKVKNKSLSRFLEPENADDTKSSGKITLVTSKVIGSESDTENMEYDNAAEIIEYTSQTGRTTPLKTAATDIEARGMSVGQTVGNVNPGDGIPSNDPTKPDTSDEIDTAFSETVILAPPTGTRIARYYAEVYMTKILNTLVAIVSIIIAIVTANKAKHYKKFYK